MKLTPKTSAFTLIELLVVISIIAILATLVTPAIQGGMLQGQLAQTLNNARQLQIATQMMSADTLQAGSGIAWTSTNDGNGQEQAASVSDYFTALTTNGYVTKNELKKLLTAPSKGPGTAEPSASNSCFTFFWVKESSPSDQPLMVTANWGAGGLNASTQPYGSKAFVVYNKGGGGAMSRKLDMATSTNMFPTDTSLGYTTQTLN